MLKYKLAKISILTSSVLVLAAQNNLYATEGTTMGDDENRPPRSLKRTSSFMLVRNTSSSSADEMQNDRKPKILKVTHSNTDAAKEEDEEEPTPPFSITATVSTRPNPKQPEIILNNDENRPPRSLKRTCSSLLLGNASSSSADEISIEKTQDNCKPKILKVTHSNTDVPQEEEEEEEATPPFIRPDPKQEIIRKIIAVRKRASKNPEMWTYALSLQKKYNITNQELGINRKMVVNRNTIARPSIDG